MNKNNNEPALIYAIRNNSDIRIINKILDFKPDINLQDNDGYTALMYAIKENNIEIINKILNFKPDINLQNKYDKTALMYAIKENNIEIINKILDFNPDINLQDDDGDTALMYAIKENNIEIIHKILNLKPNINLQNKYGITDLMYIIVKHIDTTSSILNSIINKMLDLNPNFDLQDDYGTTALMVAIEYCTPEIILKILDLKFNINLQHNDGDTALMIAIKHCTPEIINKILDLKPNVDLKNKNGDTALNMAMSQNISQNIINRLILMTNGNYYEEDSDNFSSIITEINTLPKINRVKDCKNENLITLESYMDNDNPIMIYYLNKNKFEHAGCITIDEYNNHIDSGLNTSIPSNLMSIYTKPKDFNISGIGCKPTGKIVLKLPFNNMYITYGSGERIKQEYYINKIWYALPLYGGKKRRVGNLSGIFGVNMNHGQIPGEIIYKLFRKDEIQKNIIVKETNDYPLYLYNNNSIKTLIDIIGEENTLELFVNNSLSHLKIE
jgi:ankyrin repeat protein